MHHSNLHTYSPSYLHYLMFFFKFFFIFSGVTATESSLGGLPGQAEGAAPHKIQRLHKQTQIEEDPITNTNTNINTNTILQKQTKIENDLITKTKTNAKTAKKRDLLPMGPVLHYIFVYYGNY